MLSNLIASALQELIKANQFQEDGFPGKSRVSARRAAGLAIQYYLDKNRISIPPKNAYELLLYFQTIQHLPEEIREAGQTLTLRVDESFNLPSTNDPILAAELILQWILSNFPESE